MKKKFVLVLMILAALFITFSGIKVYAETPSLPEDPEYFKYTKESQEELLKASFTEETYVHNDKFSDANIRNGIDVSYYQGDIDWEAVKQSGVEFVFIRVGYRGYGTGALREDPKADEYLKGATAAGLRVGVYIFSQAITQEEAKEEAAFIISRISGYNITMPIVMDFEYVSGASGRLEEANLTREEATAVVNAFGEYAVKAGYVPMIYANKNMLENSLNAGGIPYKIWLANYTTKTEYAGNYEFWQYSSTGRVNGISGSVDCDFWYDYTPVIDEESNGWHEIDGKLYWLDNGEIARDKEVWNYETGEWYWFESDGGRAFNKDVFVPTNPERTEGKWVRYDENGNMVKGEHCFYGGWYRFNEITGEMIKGWYTDTTGNRYYYNLVTGRMEHGETWIDDQSYTFDDITGILLDMVWYTIDGGQYWYENGVRQGTEGRGKEIYDPLSNAWYWLDAIDGGKKAAAKDVYQDTNGGKWVRYDENGRMIKGWNEQNGNTYYFDMITGAMQKGRVIIDGEEYVFDQITGILQ